MGTRNLTVVFYDGAYRVAQYGQGDGHPPGVGTTVLAFCQAQLSTPKGRWAFAQALGRCRFGTDAELAVLSQPDDWEESVPQLSRDMGASILAHILASSGELLLYDSLDFANDSLFCEWAYVIDLDLGVLELYRGGNRRALEPGIDRFALRRAGEDPHAVNAVSAVSGDYQPIRIVTAWSLDDLPSPEEFLRAGTEEGA